MSTGETFPDRSGMTRRDADPMLRRYKPVEGEPSDPHSARVLKRHGLQPTTLASIFAEITYCNSCAVRYPSPECADCEKSMDDCKTPSNWRAATVITTKEGSRLTIKDDEMAQRMRDALEDTEFKPPIKPTRWQRIVAWLRKVFA